MQINASNTNPTFGYGLTKQIAKEIQGCDTAKIQKEFRKNNIPADFQGNKIFAYCSLKCLEIIKTLNARYNLKLSLPKGVFVENFDNLHEKIDDAFGLTNLAPSKICQNKTTIFPEKTILFNSRTPYSINEFDLLSDILFDSSLQPSVFFLTPVLHEFAHVMHIDSLINNLGAKNYVNKFYSNQIPPKYEQLIQKNCCEYAATDSFEAVACDMSKRIVDHIDEKTLTPTSNPFKHGPYKKYNLFEKLSKHDEFDKIMHKFWLGKF